MLLTSVVQSINISRRFSFLLANQIVDSSFLYSISLGIFVSFRPQNPEKDLLVSFHTEVLLYNRLERKHFTTEALWRITLKNFGVKLPAQVCIIWKPREIGGFLSLIPSTPPVPALKVAL